MPKIITPATSNHQLRIAIDDWLHTKFGPNPEYDSSKETDIDNYGLPWFRAGVLVVNHLDKILMIHEGRIHIDKIQDKNFRDWVLETKRCDEGGWCDGDGRWNIPAGRLARGESFEEAALREAKEETGHDVSILGIIHVRWGKKYVMPTYLAADVSGPEEYCTKTSREVIGIQNFSTEGVHALADAGILRSPESVMGSLKAYENYLANSKDPSLLNQINRWDTAETRSGKESAL